jgi:hypothetical protein
MRTIDPNIPYLVDGKPVVGGYVYYGVANQDPKVNPITIYSDPNYTVPISNPQRTNSYGKVENRVYIPDSEYSYLVEDENNNQLLLEVVLNPLNTALPVTQDEDLNGFKFINVGDATANDQFATLGQSNKAYPITVETDLSSTPNAISATLPIPIDGLFNNQQIIVQLRHGANTDPEPTFKLEPFAPRPIYRDNNEFLNKDDTVGLDHFIHLAYNANLGKWELTNPPIQGVIENDIDMDGYKHFNVADASLPNAIVANLPVSPDSLVDGQQVKVRLSHAANSEGGITFKLNDFPAKNCFYKENVTVFGAGTTGGPGRIVDFVYSASRDEFLINNPSYSLSGSVIQLRYFTPGIYLYEPNINASAIEVIVVGGGGGGGGRRDGSIFNGWSGLGGAHSIKWIGAGGGTPLEPSFTVTVAAGGAAGIGGVGTSTPGGDGGTSSFVGVSTNMFAEGGKGGQVAESGASNIFLRVNAQSGGGDINGFGGTVNASTDPGGDSFLSSGYVVLEYPVVQGADGRYGSGGSGAPDRDTGEPVIAANGGIGGNGVVIIKEYISI